MADHSSVVIAKVGSKNVSLADLAFHLKTNFEQNLLEDTIAEHVLKEAASELGISISDADLQKAADDFRRAEGLLSAKETQEWLDEHDMSVEDMERKLEDDLLREQIQAKIVTEDKVMKTFTENISDFQRVKVGVIIVDNEGTAKEIVSQLEEGEADFVSLALKHSQAPDTQSNGGYRGRCFRKDLPDAVDAKVFDEGAPDLVGPVGANGAYYIVRIYEKMKSDLDDFARATCAKSIVDDYLHQKASEKKVEVQLY